MQIDFRHREGVSIETGSETGAAAVSEHEDSMIKPDEDADDEHSSVDFDEVDWIEVKSSLLVIKCDMLSLLLTASSMTAHVMLMLCLFGLRLGRMYCTQRLLMSLMSLRTFAPQALITHLWNRNTIDGVIDLQT